MIRRYAELTVRTNFSFLEGVSHPEEIVAQAKTLRLAAVGIADRNGLYGIVRAHTAAKEAALPLILGSRLTLQGPLSGPTQEIVFLAKSRKGYANLCRLISLARQRPRDEPVIIKWDEVERLHPDLFAIVSHPYDSSLFEPLRELFNDRLSLALHRTLESSDTLRSDQALSLSRALAIPIVATNDVHYHDSIRQPLHDVVTAIRHHTTLPEAGYLLFPNAERRLKSPEEMMELFADMPEAIERSVEIADECRFSLDELRYVYPDEFLPPGRTPDQHLRALVQEGTKTRYSGGMPQEVARQVEHELKLISELHFADYFLTIHDIVMYARSREILCQGRGSAANSVVCYLLGVTSIDPVRMNLLFERFISAERGEPPDIDVDFEHERREEVIQYIYQRYGRERAGLVAEVITYRHRSALRDVAKALGENPDPRQLTALCERIKGFPRHIATHVGGFVLTRDPLIENVPIEITAMPNRTIIQWDKNDLDALGMLKVDILGLGMLTCIRKCLDLLPGKPLTLATIPAEDPKVYDRICAADTIGVFQIESRAQMGMLPRLKPRTFHDLVIEVAIVRPGPIVGKMVHPFLRRRRGDEEVRYAHPALREILGKTCGIPLFQEQVMKIAIVVGGFHPGEADRLRRAMGIWRTHRSESMTALGDRFIEGMRKNGVSHADALAIFEQVKSFGEFGFPESHSASFALLVYASAYLKCYHPAAFACALLNSQPMGFYASHTIVDDTRRHHVEIRGIDLLHSSWDCTLENDALRLGFRLVRGLGEDAGRAIEESHKLRPFSSVEDLIARTPLNRRQALFLASSGAFCSMGLDRREAIWALLSAPFNRSDLFSGHPLAESIPPLPSMSEADAVATDYSMLGLSLLSHPVALLRDDLTRLGVLTIDRLTSQRNGTVVRIAGLAIVRQRPPTAKGMVFVTLEDETGLANIAIRPDVYARVEMVVTREAFLVVEGKLQRDGGATSVLVLDVNPARYPSESAPPIRSRDFY